MGFEGISAAGEEMDAVSGEATNRKEPGHGFPDGYARLSPAAKAAWLAGEACAEMVRAGRLQLSKVRAELRRLEKSARKVAAVAPSPCRLEEFWAGRPFPPPAENTPMVRARRVLHESERPVLWPAHYLSAAGATFDVVVLETEIRRQAIDLKPQRGESSAESPSAQALCAAEVAGAIIETDVKLLTEDERVLKQQIDRYLAGKKTSLLPEEESPLRGKSARCARNPPLRGKS